MEKKVTVVGAGNVGATAAQRLAEAADLQTALWGRVTELLQQGGDVPLPTGGVIRLRIDGVLRSGITVPLPVLARVISRIKIISRLDISDKMRPQDGTSCILR